MFPRTDVGGVSLSRMIVGTNLFLGFSHTSAAKDKDVRETMTSDRVADILEVFLKEGIDTVMGLMQQPVLYDGVREAEQRAGKKMVLVSTPVLDVRDAPNGLGSVEEVLDKEAQLGVAIVMPHQSTTDRLVNIRAKRIDMMDVVCKMIRERGMVPGLSTHMP